MPFVAIAIALTFLTSTSWAAKDQSVWPLTPYQVRVWVAVSPDAALNPKLEARLCGELSDRIEAVIGAPWKAKVAPAVGALRSVMLRGLADVDASQIPLPSADVDKLLLVAVSPGPSGTTVVARDFDVRTRTLNQLVSRPVCLPGILCEASFDAMLSAFAPLARIERLDKDKLVLRAKASSLPARDRNLSLIREGDVFRPIIRYNAPDNSLRRLTPAKWSYCTVEKSTPEEVRCGVSTGSRGELVTKGRGRIEPLALRVVPPTGSTLLSLRAKTEPKAPLPGYDVYSHPPEDKKAVTLVGRTDRQGRVVVPQSGGLVRVLVVKNGNEVLARLPMIPGLEPSVTADISNDDKRLAAEGFVAGLQQEMVDVYVRRKILMMRTKSRIDNRQFDKASELLDELRQLPAAEQFAQRVNSEQERLGASDPGVQKKIAAILDKVRKAVDKQFDPREIEDLEQELRSEQTAGDGRSGETKATEKGEAKADEKKADEAKPDEAKPDEKDAGKKAADDAKEG